MRNIVFAALGAALLATPVAAAPQAYTLDASHSQIVFSYNHLGFSSTYGMFSGFNGDIIFDQDDPANSSVSVSFPVTSMFTGWERRDQHLLSPDFFGAVADQTVRFTSTAIEVTGENTALITGDLTLNEITLPVVLDAKLNGAGDHPMAGKPWLGFDATTTLSRGDFGVARFAPFIGEAVEIVISVEAAAAD
jgi:polyisoprenoid-binding protein YceI